MSFRPWVRAIPIATLLALAPLHPSAVLAQMQTTGMNNGIGGETVVATVDLDLAGPRGAGKYTLAIMLAQTMACLQQPITDGLPDFCGVCSNCSRIALSLPLAERVNEAIAAREELREVDKKDTRIIIQTHPDVVVIPPDPPQLLIKLGQVRSVIQRIYRLPADAPRSEE